MCALVMTVFTELYTWQVEAMLQLAPQDKPNSCNNCFCSVWSSERYLTTRPARAKERKICIRENSGSVASRTQRSKGNLQRTFQNEGLWRLKKRRRARKRWCRWPATSTRGSVHAGPEWAMPSRSTYRCLNAQTRLKLYNKPWLLLNCCYLVMSSHQGRNHKMDEAIKEASMLSRACIPRNTKPTRKHGIL